MPTCIVARLTVPVVAVSFSLIGRLTGDAVFTVKRSCSAGRRPTARASGGSVVPKLLIADEQVARARAGR